MESGRPRPASHRIKLFALASLTELISQVPSQALTEKQISFS
jgi:hypothetical protein